MAFWIVYQGNSWKRAQAGGYLWAPQRGKKQQTQEYWSNMARVRPGDLIFAGVDNALRAVAEATEVAYEAERPDPRDDQFWYGMGWRLDVSYADLPAPLFYDDWVPSVVSELPTKHSPFNSIGRPNQGYLFGLPNSVGEYLVSIAGSAGVDLVTAASSAAPIPIDKQTERQILTSARVGQGQFRYDLIVQWNGRCAASGVSHPRLLRASHIKPWSSSNNAERLDPHNGLLLSAAYDAAFDALLISFDNEGSILLADDFPPDSAAAAGISMETKISGLTPQNQVYLAAHRALVNARVRRETATGE